MNIDDLVKLGAKQFSKSSLSGDAGSNLDIGSLTSALSGLTGGSGGFDLGALMTKLDAGGLSEFAKSWLGDGENKGISPEQISNAIGTDKIEEFSSKLGISVKEAAGGLSEALPQMIDKGSRGGSLLDSLGGIKGIMGLANKFFGK